MRSLVETGVEEVSAAFVPIETPVLNTVENNILSRPYSHKSGKKSYIGYNCMRSDLSDGMYAPSAYI
jgi:hypothetical protein